MEGKYVHVNGVELYSEAFGRPSDPAILLIMGAMASAIWWPEEFCRRLSDHGRYVIRYDHRDTGRSVSYPPGQIAYTVEDLADDAAGILPAYGIGAGHLVGMSLGGFLAQLVALKYPERVKTLTLFASERLCATDPEMPPMDPKIPAYHAQAGDIDWSDPQQMVEYSVGGWRLLSGSAHPFDEEGIRALALQDVSRSKDLRTSMNHALLSGGERWFNRLQEIRVPALIIHGTEDPVLPYAHALALARELPAARLVTLAGTGHELHPGDWGTIIEAVVRHTSEA